MEKLGLITAQERSGELSFQWLGTPLKRVSTVTLWLVNFPAAIYTKPFVIDWRIRQSKWRGRLSHRPISRLMWDQRVADQSQCSTLAELTREYARYLSTTFNPWHIHALTLFKLSQKPIVICLEYNFSTYFHYIKKCSFTKPRKTFSISSWAVMIFLCCFSFHVFHDI